MAAQLNYRGRFAPTPSGPLHFGSLVAALASYLDARAHNGEWFVRIEDVDQPRTIAGADQIILEQLRQHELHWDGEVIYQSQRGERYHQALKQLEQQHLTYRCSCTRKQIKALGPFYTGVCRSKNISAENTAIRFKNDQPILQFEDGLQSLVTIDPDFAAEDFVLYRRDGLYTYQLAVVVDDIDQEITDIVRGEDLLTATSWQINLWRFFTHRIPKFKHIPLALDAQARKLSKQNHAPALSADQVQQQLYQALLFLNIELEPKLQPAAMLEQAVTYWRARIFPDSPHQDTI